MSDKINLRLDWCSHEAAKYAVEHWHYSMCMPKSKIVKIGVWENDKFIGVILFNVSANNNLGKPYGLEQTQVCELVRVALTRHIGSVTRIISLSVKMLRKHSPGLRLIVSFADPEHNHVGGIYQAGNWIYTGMTQASDEYIVNGKRWHGRALRHEKPAHLTTKQAAKMIDPNFVAIKGSSKYRYLYPLDSAMRAQIEPLRKPYPKRVSGEIDSAPETNRETGGARPTETLLINKLVI